MVALSLCLPGLPGVAGLEVADWQVGGPADRERFVVELDRERVLGDMDGDRPSGVWASELNLLAADGDHPGRARSALNGHRLCRRPRWRPGRTGAAQPDD